MAQSVEAVTMVAFPSLEEVRIREAQQSPIPESWQPYQKAANVIARTYKYNNVWDEPHIGWIEYDHTETVRGQGPISGKPVRKALIGLVEADMAGTLEPPLSDDLRELLGAMKNAVDSELERRLDGYDGERVAVVRKEYLKHIDHEWFEDDGVHREAAMLVLGLAVKHGIMAPKLSQ